MNTRPQVRLRLYIWKDSDGSQTPGIGLMQGLSVKAHLTYTEARTLADRIHDLVDAAGDYDPALPVTEAERE